MVQRKVIINKLITTRSDKPLLNLQSSSLQPHHDHHVKSNNLATELKKKIMKRSGSIKLPELERVRSANFENLMEGKVLYPADATPQKQLLRYGSMDVTPNYMKSTTSSTAKKEQLHSQVSSKTPQTSLDRSVSPRKCSSNQKPAVLTSDKNESKIHSRTNSLRTVRTLMKNYSFKSTRNVVKKHSKVVLCEDKVDVRKATCSSTLKDCNFPAYLELNPGGTESEGTSMFKVCPYTYCSLNGHLHKPLPPLKLFMSAKRRALKVQKTLKVSCLSPRGFNPTRDGSIEEMQGDDIKKNPIISFHSEENNTDYFIEVCSKLSEADDREEQAPKTVSNKTVCSEVNSQEALDQTEDDDASNISSIDDVSLQTLLQEERELGFLGELDSEASDVEFEMNLVSAIYDDVEYEYTPQMEIETEFKESGDDADDKFLEDGMSQDSIYVDSDAYSISDESESTGSDEYDEESLNDTKIACNEDLKAENYLSETTDTESQVNNYEKAIDKTENRTTTTIRHLNPEKDHKPESKMKIGENIGTEHTALTQFTAKSKNSISDLDETASFNPRGPNFLPLEPDPDAEKVDLKHQEVDERKNAEEWMVDYALRQAVTRLAPARKRKVALLVEAFEKVMPVSKCEIHMRQSAGFDLARQVQACN